MTAQKLSEEVNLSVANRVLSEFISALAEDADLAEVAARLESVLLDTESVKEDALLKALFGEGAE